jgi:hypothetical protein
MKNFIAFLVLALFISVSYSSPPVACHNYVPASTVITAIVANYTCTSNTLDPGGFPWIVGFSNDGCLECIFYNATSLGYVWAMETTSQLKGTYLGNNLYSESMNIRGFTPDPSVVLWSLTLRFIDNPSDLTGPKILDNVVLFRAFRTIQPRQDILPCTSLIMLR